MREPKYVTFRMPMRSHGRLYYALECIRGGARVDVISMRYDVRYNKYYGCILVGGWLLITYIAGRHRGHYSVWYGDEGLYHRAGEVSGNVKAAEYKGAIASVVIADAKADNWIKGAALRC